MKNDLNLDVLARTLSILFIVCYVCGFLFIWDFVDDHVSFGHVSLTSSEDLGSPQSSLFRDTRPIYQDGYSAEHLRGAR